MGIRKLCIFVVYFGHKGKYTLRLCHSTPWTFRGVFLSQLSNRFGKVSHSTCPKGHRGTIGLSTDRRTQKGLKLKSLFGGLVRVCSPLQRYVPTLKD